MLSRRLHLYGTFTILRKFPLASCIRHAYWWQHRNIHNNLRNSRGGFVNGLFSRMFGTVVSLRLIFLFHIRQPTSNAIKCTCAFVLYRLVDNVFYLSIFTRFSSPKFAQKIWTNLTSSKPQRNPTSATHSMAHKKYSYMVVYQICSYVCQ